MLHYNKYYVQTIIAMAIQPDSPANNSTRELLTKNHLTRELSKKQIDLLISEIEEKTYKENTLIIKENEVSDKLFIIKEGEVEIFKEDIATQKHHSLGKISAGEVIGEMALIDQSPRSASVRTVTPSKILILSLSKLRELDKGRPDTFFTRFKRVFSPSIDKNHLPIHVIVTQNISKTLSKRLRSTNVLALEGLKNELANARARSALGLLMIYTLILLSLYIFLTHLVDSLKPYIISTTYLSIPLMIILVLPLLIMVIHSGYPLQMYGLTLKNWKRSVIESIIFTIPLLAVIVLYKAVLIKFAPTFEGRSLFEPSFNLEPVVLSQQLPSIVKMGTIFLYFIFVPVQEFLTRGIMQSSFQELFVGRYKTLWAILLSNFLFSDLHSHIALGLSIVVIIPGIFWGWLYSRHHTLIGCTLSHLITGAWALFIVGLL